MSTNLCSNRVDVAIVDETFGEALKPVNTWPKKVPFREKVEEWLRSFNWALENKTCSSSPATFKEKSTDIDKLEENESLQSVDTEQYIKSNRTKTISNRRKLTTTFKKYYSLKMEIRKNAALPTHQHKTRQNSLSRQESNINEAKHDILTSAVVPPVIALKKKRAQNARVKKTSVERKYRLKSLADAVENNSEVRARRYYGKREQSSSSSSSTNKSDNENNFGFSSNGALATSSTIRNLDMNTMVNDSSRNVKKRSKRLNKSRPKKLRTKHKQSAEELNVPDQRFPSSKKYKSASSQEMPHNVIDQAKSTRSMNKSDKKVVNAQNTSVY